MWGRKIMANIIMLADAWGFKFGGINSFNYDFCFALAHVCKSQHKVFCVAPDVSKREIEEARNKKLQLINVAKADLMDPCAIYQSLNLSAGCDQPLVWVGHDVITGEIALKCKEENGGISIVFHHMAYEEYYSILNPDPEAARKKVVDQNKILRQADAVFAVGPVLFESAQDIRDQDENCFRIDPGFAKNEHLRNHPLNKFHGVVFGRAERENTIIKQTQLAISALAKAYEDDNGHGGRLFGGNKKPRLSIIGYQKSELLEDVQKQIEVCYKKYTQAALSFAPQHYTEDRSSLFAELKNYSFAMMLSSHEGFGLVGYEAIAAGVPVIISQSSGLFKFLQENNLDGYVKSVAIEGSRNPLGFTEKDLENTVREIVELKTNYQTVFKQAKQLYEAITRNEKYSWESCAKSFLEKLNLPAEDEAFPAVSDAAKVSKKKLKSPDLNGRWVGTLIRDGQDHDFVLEIDHTCDGITCRAFSHHSTSISEMERFYYNKEAGEWILHFTWKCTSTNLSVGNPEFNGTTTLRLQETPTDEGGRAGALSGPYYSNREPVATKGRLELHFEGPAKYGSFNPGKQDS